MSTQDKALRVQGFVGTPRETQPDISTLLSRLSKVRRTGDGTWRASCPGSVHEHGDRSAGLCIREKDDGRILLWCPVGCSAEEIVGAIDMDLCDLFPPLQHHGKPERRPFPAADCLRAVGYEVIVVSSSAVTLLDGKPFSQGDRERLILAAGRIQRALAAAGLRYD